MAETNEVTAVIIEKDKVTEMENNFAEKMQDFSDVFTLTFAGASILGIILFFVSGMSLLMAILGILIGIPFFFVIGIRLYKFVPILPGVVCAIQLNSGKIFIPEKVVYAIPSWLVYFGVYHFFCLPTSKLIFSVSTTAVTNIGPVNAVAKVEMRLNAANILRIIEQYGTLVDLIANASRAVIEALEQMLSFESTIGDDKESIDASFVKLNEYIRDRKMVNEMITALLYEQIGEKGQSNVFMDGDAIPTALIETTLTGLAVEALEEKSSIKGAQGVALQREKLLEIQELLAEKEARIEKAPAHEQVRVNAAQFEKVTKPHLLAVKENIREAGEHGIPYASEKLTTLVVGHGAIPTVPVTGVTKDDKPKGSEEGKVQEDESQTDLESEAGEALPPPETPGEQQSQAA